MTMPAKFIGQSQSTWRGIVMNKVTSNPEVPVEGELKVMLASLYVTSPEFGTTCSPSKLLADVPLQ